MRTYAPTGDTPVLRELCTRDHLSTISAISPDGKCYFQVQDEAFNSAGVVRFLTHLLRVVPGRIVIIWDGAPIHRSAEVKAFLGAGAAGRVHLERLPGYAPDLNPDEGVWAYLKNVELRNFCAPNLDVLRDELKKAIKRVRSKPDVIRGCFTAAGVL